MGLLATQVCQPASLLECQSFLLHPMNPRNFPRQKGIIVFFLYQAQECYRLSELWTQLHSTVWHLGRLEKQSVCPFTDLSKPLAPIECSDVLSGMMGHNSENNAYHNGRQQKLLQAEGKGKQAKADRRLQVSQWCLTTVSEEICQDFCTFASYHVINAPVIGFSSNPTDINLLAKFLYDQTPEHHCMTTTALPQGAMTQSFALRKKSNSPRCWYTMPFTFVLLCVIVFLFHIFLNSNFALSFIILNVMCFKAYNLNFHKNLFLA